MTKRRCSNLILILLISIFLSGCSLFDGLLFTKDMVPEYSFSGYVYADGNPLEGVTVDCGLNTAFTNDHGYYSFSGLKQAVEVSVQKEGYLFEGGAKTVSGISSNINFDGYKLFEKSGIVKNGDVVVPNVSICAESKGGVYSTQSDSFGRFYLENLAGTVKVTATKDKFNFFTQSFSIHKEDDIVVSGIANISGRIMADIVPLASDFTLKLNGNAIQINDDLSFELGAVSMGDEVTIESNTYNIEKNRILVSSEDDIVFVSQKLYNIEGTVACGNVSLSGVEVRINGRTAISENGRFVIDGFYGEGDAEFHLDGYKFDNTHISYENRSLAISGLTSVNIAIGLDSGNDYKNISIRVGDKVFTNCTRQGVFALTDIALGDTVEIIASDYASVEPFKILDRTQLGVGLKRLYNVNIVCNCDALPLENVSVKIDGEHYGIVGVDGLQISSLYGVHEISFEKDGYIFLTSYDVSSSNTNVTATAFKLFDITGNIHSDDIVLNDAKLTYRGEDYYCDNLGNYTIDGAYGESNLSVLCNGYNEVEVNVNIENAIKNFDLTYDIIGIVKCANAKVWGVEVSADGVTTYTDENGEFKFAGLKGNTELTFEKEHYSINSVFVSNAQNVEAMSTYEIVGNVNTSEGVFAGLEIVLVGDDVQTTTTDKDGNYSFVGLSGNYTLYYSETTVDLKPKQYNVSVGGDYNFSNKGFNFGGVVTSGGSPLEGVTVTIGGNKTTTDANGQYLFPLVTQSGVIILSKEGYEFVGSGTTITEDFADRRDVNFDATYKIVLSVLSGRTALDGVLVGIDGEEKGVTENGVFEISGLSGNHNLSLSLNKYRFVGETSVSGYEVLSFQAYFDACVSLKTGDVNVSGVGYGINGKSGSSVSDTDGKLTIANVRLGDQITFTKDNYTFESKKIDDYVEEFVVNSSYKVSGVISNCGSPLEGVKVSIVGNDESTVLSDTQGRFEFDGIVGIVTLNFEKLGFEFENVQVSSAEPVLARCKYAVSGSVKLADGSGISGVKVYDDENLLTTTSSNGSFVVEGLSSVVLLTFVKYGYTFEGNYEVGEPTSGMAVYGTYEVSGVVASGTVTIQNAKVSVGTMFETKTDANGYYKISGLDRAVEVDVMVGGYDKPLPVAVKGYTSNANFELTYSITFVVTGEYKDITVAISGETNRTNKYSNSTITLSGLKGVNTIRLAKDSYKITPIDTYADIKVSETINIGTQLVYTIRGTVKTDEGVVVPYANISIGETTAKANENGVYEVTGLVGKNVLSATLPFNGYSNVSDIQKDYGQVEKSGTYDIVFSAKAFWLGLLNHSYDNLRNGNGYQVVGTGTVVAIAEMLSIESDSVVDVHYKQDKKGIKIFENKNNGGVAAGVDPNVSLLTLYNTKTGEVRNQFVAGKDDVLDTSVNYPATWNTWNNGSQVGTVDAYKNKYGVDIDGFSPYIINMNTINRATKVSDNGNDYVFKLEMNTSTSVANYNILMGVMCNKKDMEGFSSITLTITISKTGHIKEMKMYEKYAVRTNDKIGNSLYENKKANVTGDITYTFYTNENNTIGDIDISTPLSSVANIRTLESYDDVYTLKSIKKASTPKLDLIVCKKEEIL